ncbi:MAG: hypothetical protein ACP5OG_02060 [Candidatus Nanoarchaeia archaeon]
MEKQEKETKKEYESLLKNQEALETLIKLTFFLSIIGLFASILFLTGITGAAIGTARENYSGITLIAIFFVIWAVSAVLLSGIKKRKRHIDIPSLINEHKHLYDEK